uniref:Uncharacterized protein n=1 Tax=Rhizophora mucronata TaxID=61149 RepID=A0A2P2QI94_RHIMU
MRNLPVFHRRQAMEKTRNPEPAFPDCGARLLFCIV